MPLAGSSVPITPGSGTSIATQTIGSKEHQIVMLADQDGHIQGSAASYMLYQQPRVTTAAATDFFDIFNATGSGKIIRLRGLYPVLESTAAFTQSTTWRFDLFRTSAVGTGGTVSTFEGAAAPTTGLINICRFSTVDAGTLSANITCRALPTGGATAAAFMFGLYLQPEETNPASNMAQWVNMFPQLPYENPYELQENQGFKIRQITATASTGTNFGWLLTFAVIP